MLTMKLPLTATPLGAGFELRFMFRVQGSNLELTVKPRAQCNLQHGLTPFMERFLQHLKYPISW